MWDFKTHSKVSKNSWMLRDAELTKKALCLAYDYSYMYVIGCVYVNPKCSVCHISVHIR